MHALQLLQFTSQVEVTLNSEEIKPVALTIVKQAVSQLSEI